MKEDTKIKIAISTGGSGGHIFPAKTLAKFLKKHGYKVFIIGDEKYKNYIDSKDQIEHKIIKTGKSLKSFYGLREIIFGFFQSLFFLMKNKPDLVIGFGSYATFPFLSASLLLEKKILLHEQNSYVGKVNHLFGRFAKAIMTVYHEMYGVRFKDADKIKFVGNPVRDEIKKLSELEYSYPKKTEKFNILILAGSGGATFFSKEFTKVFKDLPKEILEKLHIVQQCREADIELVRDLYKKINVKFELKTFFKDVDKKIKDAHLIVARSGSSIFEFAIASKPMILIPSPNVTNDHQMKNAKQFADMQSAMLVLEKDFDVDNFRSDFVKLIRDKDKLKDMANNAKTMAVLNAEENILKVIKSTI